MLFFNHTKGGRNFYAADGSPSGSAGNPGANQGGAAQGDGATNAPADLFAGLDLDDLPPEVKAQLIKAKEQFATLQTNQGTIAQQLELTQRQARDFQSRHDRLQADLQRINGLQHQQQQQDPQQVLISQIEGILIKKGIAPEQAKIQAPIHAELLSVRDAALKQEIGQGMQPVVSGLLQQQATGAWQQAQLADRLGAFAIPEVAQATWEGVQHLISTGQQVTPETISNLKNMHFAAHLESNPTFQPQPQMQQQQPPHQPQYPNMATRFTFPGAGNVPQQQQAPDPNAPRHSLNADTQAALAATFGRMGGPMPKGLAKR